MPQTREIDLPPTYAIGRMAASLIAILALNFVLLVVVAFIGVAVSVILLGPDVVQAAADRLRRIPESGPDPFQMEMVQVGGLAVYLSHAAAIWLVWRFSWKDSFARRIGWADWTGDRQFWWIWLACILYALAAGLVLEWALPQSKEWLRFPSSNVGRALSLVLACFLGPVVEEMLFRGWIYNALRSKWSFRATLFATAGLFALAHWEGTHFYALVVFPIGLALGFVRERYGSIKASAFFHALYNLFAWCLAFLNASGF